MLADAQEPQLSHLLKGWHEVDFLGLVVILLAAALALALIKWIVPLMVGRWRPRYRFYTLPWIPLLRLAIILVVIKEVGSLVLEPTRENVLAVLGASAIALGFAFKDYLGSVVAGVFALIERPYRVGDWVEIDGVYGEVKTLGLRTIELVTADDTLVIIPQAKIWTSAVHNASAGQRQLMCLADFFLHPAHDVAAVRQRLWEVAITSPYLSLDLPIIIVVKEQPWGAHYRIKAYPVDSKEQFLFISDLTARGNAALAQLGVTFVTTPVTAKSA
jgi:small conductance mechanosensitive channel